MSVKETVQRKIEDKNKTTDNFCVSPSSKGQFAVGESNMEIPTEHWQFPDGYSYVGSNSVDLQR